ncbi:MAG: hypothetical protein ACOCSE_05930 [Chitinivibrionales bacterium]
MRKGLIFLILLTSLMCREFPEEIEAISFYGPFVSESSVDVSVSSGRSGGRTDNTELIKRVFMQNAERAAERYGLVFRSGEKEILEEINDSGLTEDALNGIVRTLPDNEVIIAVYDMRYSREYMIGSRGHGRKYERKIFFKVYFYSPLKKGCSDRFVVDKTTSLSGPEFIPEVMDELYRRILKRILDC